MGKTVLGPNSSQQLSQVAKAASYSTGSAVTFSQLKTRFPARVPIPVPGPGAAGSGGQTSWQLCSTCIPV